MTQRPYVSALRWLVSTLVLFLVLGHACELPAYGDIALHANGAAHHEADDHADGDLTSCDATVGLPSSTGCLHVGTSLDVAEVVAATEPVPVHLVAVSRENSRTPLSRPPLFLLHASLLI